MTSKHSRRDVLAGAGHLLADIARWHASQDRIDVLLDARKRLQATLPERFQSLRGYDPRGIRELKPQRSRERAWCDAMVAFEPVYVAAGLGQVNDAVNKLFDEHEPLGERIEAASPTSLREMAALVGVFHRTLNDANSAPLRRRRLACPARLQGA